MTYKGGGRCTQVDCILCWKCIKKEMWDCKEQIFLGSSEQSVGWNQEEDVKIKPMIKWWKLRKENWRQAQSGKKILPDDWESIFEMVRKTAKKVFGVCGGKRTSRLEEV